MLFNQPHSVASVIAAQEMRENVQQRNMEQEHNSEGIFAEIILHIIVFFTPA